MPTTPHGGRRLFDDEQTDARMRALIPRYARLGCLLVAVTSPLVSTTHAYSLAVLANVLVAAVITEAVARTHVLRTASHRFIQLLLVGYGALIANGDGLTHNLHRPYSALHLLPVLFAAVFFTGAARYTTALAIVVLDAALLSLTVPLGLGEFAVRLAFMLVVASFGAAVSGTLRESIAVNNAMHTVLETSSTDPLGERLPQVAVQIARQVTGWDIAVLFRRDGDRLDLVALDGFPAGVAEWYAEHPVYVGDASMTGAIAATGTARYESDVPLFLGPDHPVARGGVRAMAGVPLRYQGAVVGVVVLGSRTPRRFVPGERHRIGRVGEQLGLALGSATAHAAEVSLGERLRDLNARKDEFLANVSHELRTPTTAIGLAARTLADRQEHLDEAARREITDTLVRRSGELSQLVEGLLDLALADGRTARLRAQPIEWGASVTRWARTIAEQLGRDVEVDVPVRAMPGSADPGKVERILAHLVGNAVRFSRPGAPVTVRLTDADGVVSIAVRDHGIGIPPELHERVFERFFQADGGSTRATGGFGIGLSLVEQFAAAHGGRVLLTSEVGRGSTFTVELPRHVVAPADPRLPMTRQPSSAPLSTKAAGRTSSTG